MKQEAKHFLSQKTKEDLETLERYIEEFSVFLPLTVYTVSPTGIIIGVNQAAKDLTGYDEANIIGQEIKFLFGDKKLVRKFFKQILKQGLVKNQEMLLVTHNKKEIPVSVSGSIRKDDQNNIIGAFLAISDITEIKKLQQSLEKKVKARTKELEEERNKTRAALVSLTDGLIVFDKEKRISLVNSEAEMILGLKEKQVINKRIDQVTDFNNLTKLYDCLGQKIEWTGQIYELVLEKPFRRFFQVKITPMVVKEKKAGMIVTLHEITREKEIERMKTEFVSITAHQLRTPLSAIKWCLRIILDREIGEISKEQAKFLERAYQSNEKMIALINDLLNLARIEEGRFIYKLSQQSIEAIIDNIISQLTDLIKEKKVKIDFKKPLNPLPKVNVDLEKIELVVQNLLDNAIRYTPQKGKVTILIKGDKMNIEVMIKDNGIGIPAEQQKLVFSKFFRGDNALRKETEGTGLGLFICKNIIEAHQGKIWFESKEAEGTTFWFTLPIKS